MHIDTTYIGKLIYITKSIAFAIGTHTQILFAFRIANIQFAEIIAQ